MERLCGSLRWFRARCSSPCSGGNCGGLLPKSSPLKDGLGLSGKGLSVVPPAAQCRDTSPSWLSWCAWVGSFGPGRSKSVTAGLIHPQESPRAAVVAPWTAPGLPILGKPLPQAALLFGAAVRNQKNSSFHAIKTCIPSFEQSRLECSSSEFSDLAVQFAKKSASLEKSSYH